MTRILTAYFHRWLYLLFYGLWRGECAETAYDSSGRVIYVRCVGSWRDSVRAATKYFYTK